MRRDELYLADILEAANAIELFLKDVEKSRFVSDDLIRSAVLQKLTIIGEAAARITKQFKERHRDVEWTEIIAFRNLTVHAYFSIDWSIVWTTALKDVPQLKEKISAILSETDL